MSTNISYPITTKNVSFVKTYDPISPCLLHRPHPGIFLVECSYNECMWKWYTPTISL